MRKKIQFMSQKKRFKKRIHIEDASNVILSKLDKSKAKYMEVNITKNLFNFNKFAIDLKKRFSHIQIKYNEKKIILLLQ